MERESPRYDGAPVSFVEKTRRRLSPTGGRLIDGLRLAAINIAFLIVALALIGITSILRRTADALVPGPLLLPAFFIILLMAGVCAWVDWRYAEAHERAARKLNVDPDADIFGVVAALPFILLALLFVGSGLLGIFFSILTLSSSRFVDAIGHIGYGALFAALSAGIVLVARLATE